MERPNWVHEWAIDSYKARDTLTAHKFAVYILYLESRIEDYENATRHALANHTDEVHCTCVPLLLARIEKLEAQSKFDRARIRILSQAYPNARINRDKIDEEIHILNLEEEQWRAQYKDRMQELQDANIDLESRIEKLERKVQKYKYILARLQSEVLTQYPEQSILEAMMREIEED